MYVCASLCVCGCVCVSARGGVCASACLAAVLALPRLLCGLIAVFIARHGTRGRPRVLSFRLVSSAGSRALAAGATWRLVVSAPWNAREWHTSVINAAGHLFVIGGKSTGVNLRDVYVSTDAGAWPDLVRGGRVGTGWALRGTRGGTRGYSRGYSRGTQGVLC
jgi:hypothetical protein